MSIQNTLGTMSWHPLRLRVEACQVRERGLRDKPCVDQDLMRFRIDMRDGHCIVQQRSTPNQHELTERLHRRPLVIVQDTQDKMLAVERLATSLMRGEENPWMWFQNPNINCKYVEIYLDPDQGTILYMKDNRGQFTHVDLLQQQDARPY